MSELATQRTDLLHPSTGIKTALDDALARSCDLIRSQQFPDGYWWYTLEANDSINAERIFLNRYLGIDDRQLETGIAERLLRSQRADGSWSLYHGGPGDLSTTIECYFALKLVGDKSDQRTASILEKARSFVLTQGGLSKCRVFTRIHLAMFGLVPWSICPVMPTWLILLPSWFPVNVYEFSSWARASIIPLLVIQAKKKTRILPADYLDELYAEGSPKSADWSFPVGGFFSSGNFFVAFNRLLRVLDKSGLRPFEKKSLKACEGWIRDHISRTEDIYPALAYGAMALHALGYPVTDPTIQKCLKALDSFLMPAEGALGAIPTAPSSTTIYQQCCLSPVWDSPWAGAALLEAGVPADSPEILKSARWLLSKQICEIRGDWAIKNKKGIPGGWSFEFENDFFPDVDDTIQVVDFLRKKGLSNAETKSAIDRGLSWILSMQSKDGGWAAFDIDNTREFLNRIPFADHGACLDPPTPDITARAVGLFAERCSEWQNLDSRPPSPLGAGMTEAIRRGIRFIESTQEPWGGWWGRWGVNYLYGTWCVLDGLARAGYPTNSSRIRKAVLWLKSVQNRDGGFGESCESYLRKEFVPLSESVPSQTAWALMALVAAGESKSSEARLAVEWLVTNQKRNGAWDEPHHTGTGFPGHFYIRYHGYRHYFPLLAMARYRRAA